MPIPFPAPAALLPMVVPFLASVLYAHGGSYTPPGTTPVGGGYRGPGDTVPGGAGGGGPTGGSTGPSAPAPGGSGRTGAPTGPSAPAPGAPSGPPANAPPPVTGGPTGPSAAPPGPSAPAGAPGPTTGRGFALEIDTTTWDYWWEFNKDPYLQLRVARRVPVQTGSDDFYLGATRRAAARDTLRPTEDDAVRTVLPALKRVLDTTQQRDITSACMIAMAKIGRDHPDFRLVDVFGERLRRSDQEIRETAALALGIAARNDRESLALLEGLALDDQVGREARGGEAVEPRTRAFATYALGICVRQSASTAQQKRAFAVLRRMVEDQRLNDRHVKIAAIHALGLFDAERRDYASVRLRAEAVQVLEEYMDQPGGPGEQWIQAHCPTAIARLFAHGGGQRQKQRFAAVLDDAARSQRKGRLIAQSCALALGGLVEPYEDEDCEDAAYSRLLLDVSRTHTDALTRNFALLALGQIGGAANRAALLREFEKGGKALRKPWCAIALGVLARAAQDRERESTGRTGGDPMIAATLADELRVAKEPGLIGALAVALGLARATAAAGLLRERLLDGVGKQRMAGYLCIGLALMDERAAIADIRQVMGDAMRRPDLLVQAAVALGKLGDRDTADFLLTHITDAQQNLATLAACASALGFIGDRRSVAPLLRMLDDTALGSLPRAFAAAAVGGVCDRYDLPWNTPLRVGVNYGATVETLTDQRAGVLDIL